LRLATTGDTNAVNALFTAVYDELRALAQSFLLQERRDHTLPATALVHEAYVRLVKQHDVTWKNRAHFFSVAATTIRRILVDHARGQRRQKRGADRTREELSADSAAFSVAGLDLLALDEALEKLEKLDARQAQIVELHFFGGLALQEVARYLGVSLRTAAADWRMARAWLRRELGGGAAP
jgi:RNA polymerase sigma factor (TIGR02999 family)